MDARGERRRHLRVVGELASRFGDDFEQLWSRRDVEHSGKVDTAPVSVDGSGVRAWFCPGRGDGSPIASRRRSERAHRRVRVASPVISSGPVLGTLAQVACDGKIDLAGVVDRTQVHEVIGQWRENGNAGWKEPLLRTALTRAPFSGKHSTPTGPAPSTTTCTPR